ncbi:MAG: metalloregulator ArsR/SmtB family transcription factor [Nocardioides sp.]
MTASTALDLTETPATALVDGPERLLAAVADPVRWTVLRRLAAGRACVCDLQAHVTVAPNLLSYHLKVLREAGLVTTTKRGRWVDYELAPDAPARLLEALPVS